MTVWSNIWVQASLQAEAARSLTKEVIRLKRDLPWAMQKRRLI